MSHSPGVRQPPKDKVDTVCMHVYVVCMVITYSKTKDQADKVVNPGRGQLNSENEYFPVPVCGPENLVSRDGFGSPVPRLPAHLHTQG